MAPPKDRMKLYNPTDKTVSIRFMGNHYSIEAGKESDDLSSDVALHWINNVHQFLEIVKEKVQEVKKEEEPKEEDQSSEEEKVEPKKDKSSKKNKSKK